MRLLVWLLEQDPFVDWVRDERLPLILSRDSASRYYTISRIFCVIDLSGDPLYHSCMFTHKSFLPQPMDYSQEFWTKSSSLLFFEVVLPHAGRCCEA